ncbi:bifunctional demethylmenaquinone methyltransferase/2-methoxy-6-polyprenyl-1,4-benzoquinol methylase UbiE [Magnetospira thiophila]
MNYAHDREPNLDFQQREQARSDAFSPIWQDTLQDVFADVAPYYDVASDFASFGMCSRWRKTFIKWIEVQPGHQVLDVCAGTNGVGIALLKRQPDLRVSAMDRSAEMQSVGQQRARARGFEIESHIGDVHELPFADNSFDVITLQFASRHLKMIELASEIRRVLRPGGSFYHSDMLRPENPVVAKLYGAYLKACLSGTALAFRSGSAAWSCRDYFVRAIEMFYSEAELTQLLKGVGFSEVTSQRAPGGILASHRAIKR